MKKQILGSTGLSQKDAIFQIIKKLSGTLYTPNMPMQPIIRKLGPKYLFEAIVKVVLDGIKDGSIPSKHNKKDTSEGSKKTYAYQIVQYSLKHDRRLNGGKVGAQVAKVSRQIKSMKNKINTDESIAAMNTLLLEFPNLSELDKFEIHSHIAGAKFKIILNAFGVDLNLLPEDLLIELKIIDKKENAA